MATLDTTEGLYLEPDTSPYTGTTLSNEPKIIDGTLYTQARADYWYNNYSYGVKLSAVSKVDKIKCYCVHAGGDETIWYGINYDDVKVYKSSDGNSWTFVEEFNAPPITNHANSQIEFELALSANHTAQYFKVVCVIAGTTLAVGAGGASLKIGEIEVFGTGISKSKMFLSPNF